MKRWVLIGLAAGAFLVVDLLAWEHGGPVRLGRLVAAVVLVVVYVVLKLRDRRSGRRPG